MGELDSFVTVEGCEEACRWFRKNLLSVPKDNLIEMVTKLLAISLPGRGYDARTRNLLVQLKRRLNLGHLLFVEEIERAVLDQLEKSSELEDEQDTSAQKNNQRTTKKWILAGVGAVAGGLAVGLTAGLAAPFVFPALASAVGLSSLAAFFATTGGIATMTILFGAAGAGLTGYRVTRRYGDVEDFRFIRLSRRTESSASLNVLDSEGQHQMHTVIGVSGWLTCNEDVWQPWSPLVHAGGSEVYALQFERSALLNLGRALTKFITGAATSLAATEILKLTTISTALSALMFPVAILQSGDLIDNPWSVGMARAKLAGQILADVLRRRIHGHRPVDLYGFSLGSLVILSCLDELAKDPVGCFGLIENVILFGAPTPIAPTIKWHKYRCLTAGRFIHCYSRSDWVLKFLYRGASFQFVDEISGLGPVRSSSHIESVDFTGLVKGHLDYRERLPELISLLSIT